VASEDAVETVFHKFDLRSVGSVVDSNIIKQMIQFVMTLFHEPNVVVRILLPVQKEQQLVDVHTGEVDGVTGAFDPIDAEQITNAPLNCLQRCRHQRGMRHLIDSFV
jgi:hypothetical protein